MASKIIDLDRQLTFAKDYPTRTGTPPQPGQSLTAALTSSGMQFTGVQFVGSGGQFVLADNLNVQVTFTRSSSFVMNWALAKSAPFPDDLLNHEQGHFTVSALIARDFFADMMLLRDQTFASVSAGNSAVQSIKNNTINKMGAVQQLYDAEVHPEQDNGLSRGPKQKAWDGFFETAVTKYRPFMVPQSEWLRTHGQDGAEPSDRRGIQPMKIDFKRVGADYIPVCERLVDILRAAGKTI
jgi:hypothetical protein